MHSHVRQCPAAGPSLGVGWDKGCSDPQVYGRVHACMCVVRKQRVEVYLDPDTAEQVSNAADESVSEWIRRAVEERLKTEGVW